MKNAKMVMLILMVTVSLAMAEAPGSTNEQSFDRAQASDDLRRVRDTYPLLFSQGTGELAVGAATVAFTHRIFSSAKAVDRGNEALAALFQAPTAKRSTKRLRWTLNALRASLPFLVLGTGLVIAADGFVYLASKGGYSLLGSIYQRFRPAQSDPNLQTCYYRSSQQGLKELLLLPEEKAVELMRLDPKLTDLVAFLAGACFHLQKQCANAGTE